MTKRPSADEAAPYYFTYIDLVPDGDIRDLIEAQARNTSALLGAIDDARSGHRYAAGRWSIREVVSHLADTERLFVFRAFWFARGFDSPLPSFDQSTAIAAARAGERAWPDLVAEYEAIRRSTIPFFRSLPDEAWSRRGVASDCPFTVRSLAYLTVGHVEHHVRILRTRYLEWPSR